MIDFHISLGGVAAIMAEIANINTRLDALNANLATVCAELIKLRTELEALPEDEDQDGRESAWDKLDSINAKGENIVETSS